MSKTIHLYHFLTFIQTQFQALTILTFLNETFSAAFSSVVSDITEIKDYACKFSFSMDAVRFSYDGIMNIIDNLKIFCSCRPDSINTKILHTKVCCAIFLLVA